MHVSLPVRAEWHEEGAAAPVKAAGSTVNVSPGGALITLDQLPALGTRINLIIECPESAGEAPPASLSVQASVLWTEHKDHPPLAALELDFTGEGAIARMREWMDLIYEPAALAAISQVIEDQTTTN